MNNSQRSGTAFLVLFGLFWCSLVGVFDYLVGRTLVRQLKATSYPQAMATILSSEVDSHRGSESTTHGVKVSFKYRVGGQEYVSDKYSFDAMKSSDSGWARVAVAENRAGAERVCYYNPNNPAEAILKPGIDGSHLFMLMFLTPFNLVGLGLIWGGLWSFRRERGPEPRVVDRVRGTESFAMGSWTPLGAVVGTLAIGSFLGIFPIAFTAGFHPSMATMGIAWGIIAALAVVFALKAKRNLDSGKNDLVIDRHSAAIQLPAMHRRESPMTVGFKEVGRFEARTIRTGSGDDEKSEHKVFLVQKNGNEWLLKNEMSEERARALARELEKRVGIHEPLV